MLILYDKSTTNFNNLGLGVLRDFKSEPLITEVLNGLFNLEFDYTRTGWLSENLAEGNIIKANNQLFRIWNIKKSIDQTKITILAKHIFFDLEKSNFLTNVAPTDKTGEKALIWLLEHAELSTNFKVTGDCTKIASARYVRMNIIDAIYNADNCILTRFGGELELDNYNITLHNRRGKDLGVEIRQNKNLKGAEYHIDLSTVATRIIPVGRDGIMLPEKYIDSPLINNYFAPFFYKYDVDVGVDEANGVTLEDCYTKMREAVNELYAAGIDKPTVSISIDFVELSKTIEYKKYSNLETANIGDSCRVYIPSLNLNLTTRIVKTVYNCNKKRITNLELGTPKPNYVTNSVNTETIIKNAISIDNPTSILQQAKNSATELLKHPFTGYIYISEETGEFYIIDTNDINTAKNVWKFGLGGIGFSSTGINGNYEIAITQDGKIVADFITTGELDTERIKGYKQLLMTVDNNTNLLDGFAKVLISSNYLETEDAFETEPIEFSFYGDMHYTYLGETTYLPFYLYDSYLILENKSSKTKIKLPYFDLNYTDDLYDEFRIEGTRAYIIRRLDSELQPLENETIEELGNISIPLKSGYNKLYMEDFDLNYTIKYNVQNNYTQTFATKAELTLAETAINAQVITKVGENEVIAKINLSTEKDASGSAVLIQANKINIVGVLTAINNDTTTTIDGNKITTGSIAADKIKANSITASQVASDIITTTTFKAQEINADKITSGTIDVERLDASVITTTNFKAQEINADKITSGTIDVERLDASVITTTNFSAQKINADNINSGTLNIYNGSTYYLKMGFGTKHPEVSGLNVTGSGGIDMNNHSIGACYDIGTQYISASGDDGIVKCNTIFQAETLKYKDDSGIYRDVVGLYRWFASGGSDYIDVLDADGSTKLRLNFSNGLYINYTKLS